jgi:hypothetical protein
MRLRVVRFSALLFAALALVPTGAHLAELPNKIGLSAAEYLTVQQIYRGWALFGIVIFSALLSTLALAIMVRGTGRTFNLTVAALLCIAGTQVVFWTFTFPANQATVNWTTLPPNWAELRDQWEYSHAVSAGLNFIALAALILSVAGATERQAP